jgi:hypothetical protein
MKQTIARGFFINADKDVNHYLVLSEKDADVIVEEIKSQLESVTQDTWEHVSVAFEDYNGTKLQRAKIQATYAVIELKNTITEVDFIVIK